MSLQYLFLSNIYDFEVSSFMSVLDLLCARIEERMENSEGKVEDEIQTPSTSRSNSLNDEEDGTPEPVILRANVETMENESSSSPSTYQRILDDFFVNRFSPRK